MARDGRAKVRSVAALACLWLGACAGPGLPEPGATYLGHVAWKLPGNERVLIRWPDHAMPLRIHIPEPPEGLFTDPGARVAAVRAAVLAWSDVARPGVPSFTFVDRPGDADIPFAWESRFVGREASLTAIRVQPFNRRLTVRAILLGGRTREGGEIPPRRLQARVMHEVGHALGLLGHSPDPGDILYAVEAPRPALSDRDRATLAALYARPHGSRAPGPD